MSPRRVRVLASAIVLAAVCVGLDGVARAEPSPFATTCRGDGPAAERLLPTVEPLVQQYLGDHPDEGWKMPGVAFAIVTPDPTVPGGARTLVFSGGGTAETDGEAVTPSTLWEIGSESKTFTATAFAQLLLAGRVARDDRLVDAFPEGFVAPGNPCAATLSEVTLLELATHNSGLADLPPNPTWGPPPPKPLTGRRLYTQTDLFGSFAAYDRDPGCPGIVHPPGTAYLYSDWAFGFLGTVLANVYDPVTIDDVPRYGPMVAELVTGPLGMTATGLEPLVRPSTFATPTCQARYEPDCHWDNVNAFAGGGGLVSDAIRMATFVRANLGYDRDPVVWPALDLTHQPAGLGQGPNGLMGLAWEITPAPDGRLSPFTVLDKDGGTQGMHSHTYLVADACWGVTLLSNSDSPKPVGSNGLGGELVKRLAPKVRSTACAEPAGSPVEPTFTG